MKIARNCFLLCATGFAEESAEHARVILQAKGIPAPIVGLRSGAITGSVGSALPVELLISSMIGDPAERPLPDGLLVAGGVACGNRLLADPRVHRFIQHMVAAARPVGFLQPIFFPLVHLLSQNGITRPFWLQEKQKTADFMDSFVQQLQKQKDGVA